MTSNHIPQRAIGAKSYPCVQGMAAKEAKLLANTLQTREEEINTLLMIQIYQNSKLMKKYLNFLGRK